MTRDSIDRRTADVNRTTAPRALERTLRLVLVACSMWVASPLARALAAEDAASPAASEAEESAAPAEAAADAPAEAPDKAETSGEEATAAAEAEPCYALPGKFSGSVTGTSDYVFRGVSQTLEEPAIQGELDWKHESGIYLGVWGSNVKFPELDASLEVDAYAGYEAEIDDLSVKVGGIFYWYPDEEKELDYWEFPLEFGYSIEPLTFTALASYSPKYFGYAGNAVYANLGVECALPLGDESPVEVALDGSVGYTRAERAVISDRDYVDWTAGATVSATGTWSGLGVGLHYTDSDVHRDDSNARFVGSVSYEF